MQIKLHDKQDIAVFSEKPIVLLATGIQYGKTTVGAMWMKKKMIQTNDPDANFIITSPTYKILSQSTLPPFLKHMEQFGEYHRQDAVFVSKELGRCYFRTATDPDSIVGLTDVYAIYGDEAGLYSLYFFENIQARAAFRKAQILLTTSPYSLNWIWKDLIRPKLKDPTARPDVDYIKARSIDNPHFPKDYWERMKATMDPRRFSSMFGGDFNKNQGLVYMDFDEDLNSITPFALPPATKFYCGVDFGHTHPFVAILIAITPDGNRYQLTERYKTGLTVLDMIAVLKQLKQYYPIEMFFCDPSQPGHIEEFNRAGLTSCGANNNVQVGISLVYELIKTRRYKIFRGDNKYTIDSLEVYHYKSEIDDIDSDTDLKERNPIKQDDDCADALRYVLVGTYDGYHRKIPQVINHLDLKEKKDIYQRARDVFEPPDERYESW